MRTMRTMTINNDFDDNDIVIKVSVINIIVINDVINIIWRRPDRRRSPVGRLVTAPTRGSSVPVPALRMGHFASGASPSLAL